LVASHDTQVVKDLGQGRFGLLRDEFTLEDLICKTSLWLCVPNVLSFGCLDFLIETLGKLGLLLLTLLSLLTSPWLSLDNGHFGLVDSHGLGADYLRVAVSGAVFRGTIATPLNLEDSVLGQRSDRFFYPLVLREHPLESYQQIHGCVAARSGVVFEDHLNEFVFDGSEDIAYDIFLSRNSLKERHHCVLEYELLHSWVLVSGGDLVYALRREHNLAVSVFGHC